MPSKKKKKKDLKKSSSITPSLFYRKGILTSGDRKKKGGDMKIRNWEVFLTEGTLWR